MSDEALPACEDRSAPCAAAGVRRGASADGRTSCRWTHAGNRLRRLRVYRRMSRLSAVVLLPIAARRTGAGLVAVRLVAPDIVRERRWLLPGVATVDRFSWGRL
ncbi:MAG TPA: hypothetical protein VFZ66_06510 [Herpetosiphonaceae bacterium]